ncbi:MAG: hypothetical protein ACTTKL_06495 [Treponema sp.]
MGNGLVYGKEINLMDEKLFPRDSEYRRKKNPKKGVTRPIVRTEISDEEIIKSVSESMANSLGAYFDD